MSISKQNISASVSKLVGALLAAGLVFGPAGAQAPSPAALGESAPLVLERLAGKWAGTILFRNSLSGAMETVPATMTGTVKGNRLVLDMEADDGKGRIVRQPFTITIQPHRKTLTRNPGDRPISFALTGNLAPAPGDPLALDLVGRGSEGSGPVDIHETISIVGSDLVWRRENRLDGQPYGFRSEYRLTRQP